MSSQQSHLRPVTSDGGSGETAERQQPRQHAAKALPTDRMKMDRQINVLRSLGSLSGPRQEDVNADNLSRAVGGVAATTVILSNRFFAEAGWITIPGKGHYAATDALVEYGRRLDTGSTPEYAAEALRAPARKAWFWTVLEPYITDGRRLPVNEAAILLMRAADATGGHLPLIRNLITWLEYIGLVMVRDEHMVAAAETTDAKANPARVEPPPVNPAPAGKPAGSADAGTQGEKSTVHGGGEPPATVVAFSFDVKVTAADLERLTADQIKALFEAVGAVMAIKQRG